MHHLLMNEDKVEFATAMFKLLGHPLRLRMIELLDIEGEKTVNEIVEATGQPQSTVSLYLNRLKTRRLLKSRRDGNQAYYSIDEPKLRILLNCLRECPLED